MSFLIALDILLALVNVIICITFWFLGLYSILFPIGLSWIFTVIIIHIAFYYKVLMPLKIFSIIADQLADGETPEQAQVERLKPLGEVRENLNKIITSFIESREAIENYMKTISDINKELEKKVHHLSVLYTAGKVLGTTLNLDSIIRTILSLFLEKLDIKAAAIMLYNEQNDLVSIRDMLGFSPELFAKFKFYSDHKVIAEVFNENGYWLLDDHNAELLKAEFDTDSCRDIKVIMPMRIKDHFVGLLVLGEKCNAEPYSNSDLELLLALTSLFATSINNARLYEKSEATKNELDRKVFNLLTLQQSGKVLSSTLNLDELIKIAIDMFLETVWANKGVLMLYNDETLQLEVKAVKGIDIDMVKNLEKDPLDIWAMTTLQKEKRPILAQDLANKSVYLNYNCLGKQLPFAVYLPLIKEGDLYGVVKIGYKINGEPFTESDLEFLFTLASQAVISFENARLYSLAITDSITKLYVHRYFQLRLDEEVKRSKRYNSALALLMCDIDHFKEINDKYGHQQGDLILKEISKILKKNIRSTDIAARYGGEEFVIILPETTQADARIVAERIRRDVANYPFSSIVPGNPPLHVTISIGVAGFPINASDKDELIQKADCSMYIAKGKGRNKVVLYGIDN